MSRGICGNAIQKPYVLSRSIKGMHEACAMNDDQWRRVMRVRLLPCGESGEISHSIFHTATSTSTARTSGIEICRGGI